MPFTSLKSVSILSLLLAMSVGGLAVADDENEKEDEDEKEFPVKLKVAIPADGDIAGYDARAYIVAASVQFPGVLSTTGLGQGINPASGNPTTVAELTGPGAHQQLPPFPGNFTATANSDHFPGFVIWQDTFRGNARVATPTPDVYKDPLLDVKNVAGLFEITTVINQTTKGTKVWTDWIQGGSGNFGRINEVTETNMVVTMVEGQAPNAIVDANSDGVFDENDLTAMGYKVISNTVKIKFFINGCQPGKLKLQKPNHVVTGAAACEPRTVPVLF